MVRIIGEVGMVKVTVHEEGEVEEVKIDSQMIVPENNEMLMELPDI